MAIYPGSGEPSPAGSDPAAPVASTPAAAPATPANAPAATLTWAQQSAPEAGIQAVAGGDGEAKPLKGTGTLRKGENLYGWMFVSPAVAILLVFLALPILLALYISFTNWSGLTSPLSSSVQWVGLHNYSKLITSPDLDRYQFATAIRNNFYFVLFTVPLQTALALFLAIVLNNKLLKGQRFFRTAFYFPSVTSSIAIATIFIFLFQGTGVVNTALGWIGITGPDWLHDQRGVITLVLNAFGVNNPAWGNHSIMGLPVWDWIAGPSLGMLVIITMVVWTTGGTFMLFFLSALQGIGDEVDEASAIDGATPWQRFRRVTLPLLRPSMVLVVTLGFISTWQVFDQSYLVGPNNPTTITAAFFSYQVSFQDFEFGEGAAVAFLLFCLIVILTLLQRRFVKEDLTR